MEKYLLIDIGEQSFRSVVIPEETFSRYFGGRYLSAWLYTQHPGSIVLAPSYLSDVEETSFSTLSCTSRSMINGHIETCSFRTDLGKNILLLGYRAVVLTGRARRLCAIIAGKDKVEFSYCEPLHGVDRERLDELMKEVSPGYIAIGSRGEMQDVFTSIDVNGQCIYRSTISADFGSRNLKVLVFEKSEGGRPSKNMTLYDETVAAVYKKYPRIFDYGSAALFRDACRIGYLAAHNFSDRCDMRTWGLGGCDGTRDSHLGFIILSSLGSNIGIFDHRKVQILKDACDSRMLDIFYVGNVLAELSTFDASFMDEALDIIKRMGEGRFREDVSNIMTVDGVPVLPIDYRPLVVNSLYASCNLDMLDISELMGRVPKRRAVRHAVDMAHYTAFTDSVGFDPLLAQLYYTGFGRNRAWKRLELFAKIALKIPFTRDDAIELSGEYFRNIETGCISMPDRFRTVEKSCHRKPCVLRIGYETELFEKML